MVIDSNGSIWYAVIAFQMSNIVCIRTGFGYGLTTTTSEGHLNDFWEWRQGVGWTWHCMPAYSYFLMVLYDSNSVMLLAGSQKVGAAASYNYGE